jgi:hypothetical protein
MNFHGSAQEIGLLEQLLVIGKTTGLYPAQRFIAGREEFANGGSAEAAA